MPRRGLALLAVLALTALVAGCAPSSGSNDSAEDFRGDQRAVAAAVEDLEEAASNGDQDKICRDLLAPALVRQLSSPRRGCPAAVDAAIKNTDTFAMDVESVRISGNAATARVKLDIGDADRTATVRLARLRPSAGWRIATLQPSPVTARGR